ncbi:HD domain-containing protein [Nocardioides mesophilus]|uniref:HD domain-containing protein n=1 Tax=Nocardioides mesophilus TaxID=433659 RepID=A0A7G9RDX5_9ACTN|nr:HD domain-containing protein [Nocardioides mesophilus]QNN53800.1 HD domain-containing protein [Nocardioides mesophilus]
MDLAAHWPLTGQEALRGRLETAYADPARGYHDRTHLAEVLTRLDELAGDQPEPDRRLLRLAAWFHDAVYDAGGDLEERSARLAEAELAAAGLPPAEVAEVARLVRLTAGHRPADDDRLGGLLCDADLAILAAGPQRYADYVAGVRREHADVPEAAFRAGRAAVLRDLAAKPTLFHTARARELWEQPARANLERELTLLEGRRR